MLLPLELFVIIMRYACKSVVASLSICSSTLRAQALPFLFHRICLTDSCDTVVVQKGLPNLQHIVTHVVLKKCRLTTSLWHTLCRFDNLHNLAIVDLSLTTFRSGSTINLSHLTVESVDFSKSFLRFLATYCVNLKTMTVRNTLTAKTLDTV